MAKQPMGDSDVVQGIHIASATLGYHAELGENSRFDLTISRYYGSRVYFDFPNQLSQKPYFTLDAAATVTLDERFTFSVFAKPRVYGVSLGYRF